jgi:hypothetical protein
MLGHIACMEFCAAVDVQAVALDHDRQLHREPARTPL